ncbi:MAG: efflux RND transporter periplasmic adaptor subunit [Verrucomicrobia bacterium]|nr:MAG: efflux RND transporter periplasmic adaptor subunit [Verrucomicrobiota bacterium]
MGLVPVMKKGGGETKPAASPQMQAARSGGEKQPGQMQGMEGVPGMPGTKPEAATQGAQTREFVVPVERQQQIGVTYAMVERKPLRHTIRSVGLVVPDKGRNWQFVSRVDGYVQKLDVKSPGEIVEKGAPLLSIYSPDLLTSEREFVELLRMRDQAKTKDARETPERLIESAKRRLQLWNVTNEQITELQKTRNPRENLTLLSPFRGVVWVWAEFYENELPMLKVGQKMDITAKSYPGEKFEGTISLINPFLEEAKRTAKVRIDIPNPDFKLRPAMYVNAELGMDMGEGLTIPVSAVMPTGTRNVAFINKGEGKLEPRIVQLGSKYGESYEVQSGLREGEQVVASANFLIDAESKVQQALNEFEPSPSPNESPVK